MLRGYWRVVVAIIGLAGAFGAGIGATSLWYAEKQQQQTIAANTDGNNYKDRPQQYLSPRSGIPAPVESAISNPQPRSGQDHEKRDLAAQEASATFAWWMVVVSAFGFFVTTIGTILLYKQIMLTREAVEDTGDATAAMIRANKIAEAAQRPYLHVEKIGWKKVQDSSNWVFVLSIKNFGQTPARNFSITADVKYSIERQAPLLWSMKEGKVSDLIPQSKTVDILVTSSDPRTTATGADASIYKEDAYFRFKLEYQDAFGNTFGLFETHCQRNRVKGDDGNFRFHSSP